MPWAHARACEDVRDRAGEENTFMAVSFNMLGASTMPTGVGGAGCVQIAAGS
jgi:hypothetical protein